MKTQLLEPKIDFIFKKIFCPEKNKDILINFLNDTLKLEDNKKITQVELKNKQIMDIHIDSDTFMIDFTAIISDENSDDITSIDIIINIKNDRTTTIRTEKRIEYLIMEQLLAYDELNKTNKDYYIFLVDGLEGGTIEKHLNKFMLDNQNIKVPLSNLKEILEVCTIDFNKLSSNNLWERFLNNPTSELLEEAKINNNTILINAFEVLEEVSKDETNQYLYHEYKRDLEYYLKNN